MLAEIGTGAFSQIGDGRLPAEGDESRCGRISACSCALRKVLCAAPPERQERILSLGGERPGLRRPGEAQLDCFLAQPEAGSHPRFNAWIYAFETLIPGLDAGQRSAWSPDTRYGLGLVGKIFEYIQMVAGFGLGLLAFAGFSGLVKSK
jgi:hypothetical protein